MAEIVRAGTYDARVVDYGVGSNKKGDPQIEVKFAFNADGQERTLTWFGGVTDKSLPHTMKALHIMGFDGSRMLDELADGVNSGILDTIGQVSIVVEHDTYEGKTFARVKWINQIGGAGFRNLMDRGQAKTKLGAVNWKGALAAVKQDMGAPKTQTRPMQKAAGAEDFDPEW